MTNVLLIADTHLGPGQAGRLIERIGGELADADVVLHAGDITDARCSTSWRRARRARVHAVEGNNDHGLALPERLTVEVDGCVDRHGPRQRRRGRPGRPPAALVPRRRRRGVRALPPAVARDRRPAADGHVQHHVNPGSAMLRRRAPTCTVARLVIDAGAVTSVRHVPVG